jgi:ribosome-associated protein
MYIDAKELALIISKAADEKKAEDILIMDMQGVTVITDYFVICTGRSGIQVQAITDNIEEKMEEAGIRVSHREGYREAKWVLLDYGSVIVHVFQDEDRAFYDLERLWADAPSFTLDELLLVQS